MTICSERVNNNTGGLAVVSGIGGGCDKSWEHLGNGVGMNKAKEWTLAELSKELREQNKGAWSLVVDDAEKRIAELEAALGGLIGFVDGLTYRQLDVCDGLFSRTRKARLVLDPSWTPNDVARIGDE